MRRGKWSESLTKRACFERHDLPPTHLFPPLPHERSGKAKDLSTDQAHIVKSLAMEVVRELVEDDQFIRTYVREHLRLLTLEDLQAVTGFGEKKIRQLRDEGYLPMFRMPESNEWRITREAWEASLRRMEKEGITTSRTKTRRRRR